MRLIGSTHWTDLRGPAACELLTEHEVEAVRARLGEGEHLILAAERGLVVLDSEGEYGLGKLLASLPANPRPPPGAWRTNPRGVLPPRHSPTPLVWSGR